MRFFSKLRTAIALGALVLIFIAPALALAQTASTPASSSATTWTQTDCENPLVGGEWDPATNDCYSKEKPVPIMISVGGATGTTTLTKYISEFYKFATAGAAVLAVIYLMIGGFQILASAGGEQVGEGRKKITNAILGLVLVFCSYVLLQTVNPALVNLQAPRIKLVKASYLNALNSSTMAEGDACWTESDAAACKAACDGCVCLVLKDPPLAKSIETFTSYTVEIGGLAASLAANGIKAAVTGTLNIIGKTADTVWSATKIAYQAGKAAGGVAGGIAAVTVDGLGTAAVVQNVVQEIWGKNGAGEKGICLRPALNDIPTGGLCGSDGGCITGSCFITDSGLGTGYCIRKDGTLGSSCIVVGDCKHVEGNWVACRDLGKGFTECTDGSSGEQCQSDDDCAPGLACKLGSFLNYQCTGAATGKTAENGACASSADCAGVASGSTCSILGAKGICTSGAQGAHCFQDTSCSSGLVCKQYCASATCVDNFASKGVDASGVCDKKDQGSQCFMNSQCASGLQCCGASGDPTAGQLETGICMPSCQ